MDPARPGTPQSPLTNSLYRASSTIDDLTAALTDFSRVPSPEPPSSLACCCGREDCQNLAAWLNLKSRLESRLILSAEVGQALLQRHEAYVRQFENRSRKIQADDEQSVLMNETLDEQVSALMKEKAVLERRLHQVLVNNEVTEVSNKTILQELQDARTTISRLTAHHARSVGWDTRLAAAAKECDDMQQERDSESHRAQLAETRLATLKDKTTKLQVEVRRLQESLEEKRLHRLESSESILQDARVRLETIHKSQLGASALVEQDELMKVLESLVKDNEALKRDSAELQNLLAESREDYHALRQEIEEQRANPPPPPVNTHSRHSSKHSHNSSTTSISFNTMHQRAISVDRRSIRTFEPLTPLDSPRALLSPISRTSFRHGPPPLTSPLTSPIDGDDDSQDRPKGLRPLLLLSRSCGVQTEPWTGQLTPSPLPSHLSLSSPLDPRSESSSFSESLNSHISTLLDRVAALLNRMTQADALTLRNRLKRQHLKGADVNHLSRSTVGNIVNEATSLRAQFRILLEDESLVTTCTRKDLRLLFKLLKDFFTEMGQMRVTLNEVVLDPSAAPRISELALNPTKAEAELHEKERDTVTGVSAIGWMAPISKLFSHPVRVDPISTPERTPRGRTTTPRFVPKLGPALAASATTVNVEFSGTGVGRSVSSTAESLQTPPQDFVAEPSPLSQSVMGIFAGAPKPSPTDPDNWVVLPKAPRRVPSFVRAPETPRQGTIRRSTGRMIVGGGVNGLSRNVDAVIDVKAPLEEDEEPDSVPPLLERTLRRRGLSDSSIHSSFTAHGDDATPLSPAFPDFPRTHTKNLLDRGSVFQVLSRTVQNFRLTPSGSSNIKSLVPAMERSISEGGNISATTSQLKVASDIPRKASSGTGGTLRSSSPGIAQFLPTMSLASWAAANVGVEPIPDVEPFIPGSSFREESFMHRNTPRKEYEREFAG